MHPLGIRKIPKTNHANYPAEQRATPRGIHVFPLANRRGTLLARYVTKVLILWY
jgi:hypothetical protein